jgi:hypothetical protein
MLGPDLDQDSESGSTNPVELGFNPLPHSDKKHCFISNTNWFLGENFATKQNTGAKGLCWLLPQSRVHIFTRDETGSEYLPTQLERTLQLYW